MVAFVFIHKISKIFFFFYNEHVLVHNQENVILKYFCNKCCVSKLLNGSMYNFQDAESI